jgi:hypothetical protein
MQTLQSSRLKREKPIVVVGRHGLNLRVDIARPLVQIARIAIEEQALRRIPLATEALDARLGAGQNELGCRVSELSLLELPKSLRFKPADRTANRRVRLNLFGEQLGCRAKRKLALQGRNHAKG